MQLTKLEIPFPPILLNIYFAGGLPTGPYTLHSTIADMVLYYDTFIWPAQLEFVLDVLPN